MKKLLCLALALAMMFAITVPAMALKLSEPITEFDFTNLDYNNCDNWNVKQKDDCFMTVETIPGTIGTYYSFDMVIQSSGKYSIVNVNGAGVYEVTKNTKNINMVHICDIVKHEFAKVNISKVWLDKDGEVITGGTPKPLFTDQYEVGEYIFD